MNVRAALNRFRWSSPNPTHFQIVVQECDGVSLYGGDRIADVDTEAVWFRRDTEKEAVRFGRVLALLDQGAPLWFSSRLAIPFEGTALFACVSCCATLTTATPPTVQRPAPQEGKPLLKDRYWIDDGAIHSAGWVVLAGDAVRGSHDDKAHGCCGPSGDWFCECGHSIGYAYLDCCGPHFVALDPQRTRGLDRSVAEPLGE